MCGCERSRGRSHNSRHGCGGRFLHVVSSFKCVRYKSRYEFHIRISLIHIYERRRDRSFRPFTAKANRKNEKSTATGFQTFFATYSSSAISNLAFHYREDCRYIWFEVKWRQLQGQICRIYFELRGRMEKKLKFRARTDERFFVLFRFNVRETIFATTAITSTHLFINSWCKNNLAYCHSIPVWPATPRYGWYLLELVMCEHRAIPSTQYVSHAAFGCGQVFLHFIYLHSVTHDTVNGLWSTNEKTFARENAIDGRAHGTAIGRHFNFFLNSFRFQTLSLAVQAQFTNFTQHFTIYIYVDDYARNFVDEAMEKKNDRRCFEVWNTSKFSMILLFFLCVFYPNVNSLCHFDAQNKNRTHCASAQTELSCANEKPVFSLNVASRSYTTHRSLRRQFAGSFWTWIARLVHTTHIYMRYNVALNGFNETRMCAVCARFIASTCGKITNSEDMVNLLTTEQLKFQTRFTFSAPNLYIYIFSCHDKIKPDNRRICVATKCVLRQNEFVCDCKKVLATSQYVTHESRTKSNASSNYLVRFSVDEFIQCVQSLFSLRTFLQHEYNGCGRRFCCIEYFAFHADGLFGVWNASDVFNGHWNIFWIFQ